MNELIILTPEDCDKNKPTKILDKNLNLVESFSGGFNFYFETLNYENFHEAMERVFELESSFIVLGKLTDYGQLLEETQKAGPRRKKKGEPTLKDTRSKEIVLDLDDHILPDFNPLDPEPAIKKWLAEKKINCDVTWQITSGQKLDSDLARIRLYFVASKPLAMTTRKAWAQSPEIMADGSVFSAQQPIYTAPPVIEGGKDPIPVRNGFIKGEYEDFEVPKLTTELVEKYSGYHRGGIEYDFDSRNLPEEVLTGEVYRRYFMPYAFSLANKGLDRDEIFLIIQGKSSKSPREFNPDNTYQYIDDALDKIELEENDAANAIATSEEIGTPLIQLPKFPRGFLKTLPDPWPMIFENYKGAVAGDYVEAILFATVISTNAHFLKSKYLTNFGKIPNTFNLILYPSGGGKDANSTQVIKRLSDAFNMRAAKTMKNMDFFSAIHYDLKTNISSDTAFMNAFDKETQSLFMLDTEATKTMKKINNKSNENVANLGEKFIESANGSIIRAKNLATQKQGEGEHITNPTCQIFLAGQPDTTGESLEPDNLSSGLLARCNIFYEPPKENITLEDLIGGVPAHMTTLDDDFYNFYTSGSMQSLNVKPKTIAGKILKYEDGILDDWMSDKPFKIAKENPDLLPLMKRAIYPAEQLYTILLGIMQEWDIYKGNEIRTGFDPHLLIPILDFYIDTKLFLLDNVINKSIDPFEEAIIDVVSVMQADPERANNSYRQKIKDTGYVPLSAIKQRLRSSKYRHLKEQYGSATDRLAKTIKHMTETGSLLEKMDGRKPMYAIPKDK